MENEKYLILELVYVGKYWIVNQDIFFNFNTNKNYRNTTAGITKCEYSINSPSATLISTFR